jgi:hypothetical protein
MKPILDRKPTKTGHNWSFSRIQAVKAAVAPRAASYQNQYAPLTAPRDQDARGTCTGQAPGHGYDIKYMMLTKDMPTDTDKAQFKKDVVDSYGTTHDILYPQSASAECFYQEGRLIGNITGSEGGEIFDTVKAWCEFGMALESQWHTDKKGTAVWDLPVGPRSGANGGIDLLSAAAFASLHRADGYAQIGTSEWGNPSWDLVCDAIWTNGFILGAIPVFDNYGEMSGGDGTFPEPQGGIAGYHALCFYGYDADWLYLLHSWGGWCVRYGRLSRTYFEYVNAHDAQSFYAILDSQDVLIARTIYSSLSITSNVPAHVAVDGAMVGDTPRSIAIEKGTSHVIVVSADGYIAQTKPVDDSVTEWNVTLEPVTPPVVGWFRRFIEWLIGLI